MELPEGFNGSLSFLCAKTVKSSSVPPGPYLVLKSDSTKMNQTLLKTKNQLKNIYRKSSRARR